MDDHDPCSVYAREFPVELFDSNLQTFERVSSVFFVCAILSKQKS